METVVEMGIVYFKAMAHSSRMMISKCDKRKGYSMHMMNGKYFAQLLYLTSFRILYGCILIQGKTRTYRGETGVYNGDNIEVIAINEIYGVCQYLSML